MAFEVSNTGFSRIDPLFAEGFNTHKDEYHNIGMLTTPYQGKRFGSSGDYGPPQATKYYTDYNRNYPYVLDADFHPAQYLPTRGCSPCCESNYPDFVPSNYFSPQIQYPFGHAKPINRYLSRPNSGTVNAYIPKKKTIKEGYSGNKEMNFDKLPVANHGLKNTNNFYPFGENLY